MAFGRPSAEAINLMVLCAPQPRMSVQYRPARLLVRSITRTPVSGAITLLSSPVLDRTTDKVTTVLYRAVGIVDVRALQHRWRPSHRYEVCSHLRH